MINARFTTSAFVACAAATPMMADELACVMTDGSDVAFTIDRNQFVDARQDLSSGAIHHRKHARVSCHRLG